MKLYHISASLLALVAGLFFARQAFAQTEVIPAITENHMLMVVAIGIFAGLVRAYQGYRKTGEDFDTLKFLDSVITSAIVSVPLAIGSAILQTEFNVFTYVTVFGAAIGFTSQIQAIREKTIPSNATIPKKE